MRLCRVVFATLRSETRQDSASASVVVSLQYSDRRAVAVGQAVDQHIDVLHTTEWDRLSTNTSTYFIQQSGTGCRPTHRRTSYNRVGQAVDQHIDILHTTEWDRLSTNTSTYFIQLSALDGGYHGIRERERGERKS